MVDYRYIDCGKLKFYITARQIFVKHNRQTFTLTTTRKSERSRMVDYIESNRVHGLNDLAYYSRLCNIAWHSTEARVEQK